MSNIKVIHVDQNYFENNYRELRENYVLSSLEVNKNLNRSDFEEHFINFGSFFHPIFGKKIFNNARIDTMIMLAATVDGKIVGLLIANNGFDNHCQLATLYVQTKYDKEKIGSSLLLKLEELVVYDNIWVEVIGDDKIYKKNGYKKVDDNFYATLTRHRRYNCYAKKIK